MAYSGKHKITGSIQLFHMWNILNGTYYQYIRLDIYCGCFNWKSYPNIYVIMTKLYLNISFHDNEIHLPFERFLSERNGAPNFNKNNLNSDAKSTWAYFSFWCNGSENWLTHCIFHAGKFRSEHGMHCIIILFRPLSSIYCLTFQYTQNLYTCQ